MTYRWGYLWLVPGVLGAVAMMFEVWSSRPGQVAYAQEAKDKPEEAVRNPENDPASVKEARGRARLLHETIHGALQVMHRDFFREDEKLTIPSESLEDVFAELSRIHNVKLHWLAVDTPAMNVDHDPDDAFEKNAVKALKAGQKEFESVEKDSFRYAAPVRLASECLKCHLPLRTSNKDRKAGLAITMPLRKP